MYPLPPDTKTPLTRGDVAAASWPLFLSYCLSHRDALSLISTADTSVTTCGRAPGETVHPLSPPPTTPWWDTPHPRRSSPHSITAECLLKCALQWRWMRAGNWLDDIFRGGGGDAALFKTRGGRPLLRAKNNDVSLLFIMSGLVKARQITSSSLVNRFVKGWQTSKSDYSNILNWLIAEHVGLQYK